MKVIQVLNSWDFYGAENVVVGICKGLQERGVETLYVSTEGSVRKDVEMRGVKYVGVKSVSVRRVRELVKREHANIVHAHDMYAGFICALATIGIKCVLVVTVHNNFKENGRLSLKSVAFLVAMLRAKIVYWVSEDARKGYVFERFFKNKCEVMGNIANVDGVNNKEKSWDIAFVGRVEDVKNPIRFVRIVNMIRKHKPNIKAVIVGDGDMRLATEKEIVKLKLENNIEMLGYRHDAVELIAMSKVVLMTSLTEGIPMVALEAMAVGVPVVGTNVGGMKEVVNEKWLCEKDEDLVAAVIDLLDSGCDDYVWHVGMSRKQYIDILMNAYLN